MVIYSISEFTEEDLFKTKQTPQLEEKYKKVESDLLEKINSLIQEVSEKEHITIYTIPPTELYITVDLSIPRL